jgi:uncharacterized membrane protein YkoI
MKNLIFSLLLIALLGTSQAVTAAPPRGQDNGQSPERSGVSREQAADIAVQRSGGRVLDIKRRQNGYEVKVLSNGRVRVLNIDGQGQVRD